MDWTFSWLGKVFAPETKMWARADLMKTSLRLFGTMRMRNCNRAVTPALVFMMLYIFGGSAPAHAFNLPQFTAGFLTEYALHEGGHELVAHTKKVPITWESGRLGSWRLNQAPTDPKEAGNVRLMAMSGLAVQSISRKITLQEGWVKGDYNLGRIAYSFGNAFWYAGRQLLSKKGAYHDFGVYENAGGNADRMAVLILLDAGFDTWRLLSNKDFTTYISSDGLLKVKWRW